MTISVTTFFYAHLLTRNASRRRSRFVFSVGRNRVTSIRRNRSRHRRAPSSATAVSRRQSTAAVCSEEPKASRDKSLRQTEVDTLDSPKSTSMELSGGSRHASKRPMAPRKDTDLPPVPVESVTSHAVPDQHKHSGIMHKLTTKLRRSSMSQPDPHPSSSHERAPPLPIKPNDSGASEPVKHKRKTTLKLPSMPAMPKAPAPTLPNSFTSPEQRQAALRAMGLIPARPHPYKDAHGYMVPLSEQEKYLDNKFTVVPEHDRSSDEEGESEAKKIREAWLKKNKEQEAEPLASSSPSQPQPEAESPVLPSQAESPSQLSRPQPRMSSSSSSSSPRRSTSADIYRNDTMSPAERASEPALIEDNTVLSLSQSMRHGTLMGINKPIPPTPKSIHSHPEPVHPSEENHIPRTPRDNSIQITLQEQPVRVEEEHTQVKKEDRDNERRSSDASEKVSRWLQSTPTGSSFKPTPSEPSSPQTPRSVRAARADSPTDKTLPSVDEDQSRPASSSTPSSTTPSGKASPVNSRVRKEKPSPISITATAIAVKTSPSTPPSAIPIPLQSPPVAFDDPRSPRAAALPKLSVSPPVSQHVESPTRGRSLTASKNEHLGALGLNASTSSRSDDSQSRSQVPALSPTRTASSSAASEIPPTPTTTSHQRGRKVSIVSSTSQSSDNHYSRNNSKLKVQTVKQEEQGGKQIAASAIVESPAEEADDGINEIQNSKNPGDGADGPLPMPRPRPPRQSQNAEESLERGERRKSITFGGLFGSSKSSPNGSTAPNPEKPSRIAKPSRSMTNLRRSVAGTISSKLRPKTIVVDTSSKALRSTSSSNLSSTLSPSPPSSHPSVPPSAYRGPTETLEAVGKSRPRPRQPISPTIHSRGSILMEARGIEDAESRRLSELAFLDF